MVVELGVRVVAAPPCASVFAAGRSEKILLNVRLQNGSLLPFGTTVQDDQGASVGVVGQAGQVLLSAGKGVTYTMKWGGKAAQQCEINLDISSTPATDGYRVMDAVCVGVRP